MHRYDGLDKQTAEQFAIGNVRTVLPEAIGYLVDAATAIIESWTPRL